MAFFNGPGGNVNPRGNELITCHGTDGDVQQYAFDWIDGSGSTAAIKGRGCSYGVIGYTIGLYCKRQAAKTGTLADLAAACAVYGYYAKQLFG